MFLYASTTKNLFWSQLKMATALAILVKFTVINLKFDKIITEHNLLHTSFEFHDLI